MSFSRRRYGDAHPRQAEESIENCHSCEIEVEVKFEDPAPIALKVRPLDGLDGTELTNKIQLPFYTLDGNIALNLPITKAMGKQQNGGK